MFRKYRWQRHDRAWYHFFIDSGFEDAIFDDGNNTLDVFIACYERRGLNVAANVALLFKQEELFPESYIPTSVKYPTYKDEVEKLLMLV